MTIRNLFDPNRGLDRPIEKVITFAAKQEARLKAEISEYVVTDSIEDQFRKLLERMQLAMEAGGENETGVWVSGFYGSGKSSLTKYLGFAFDDRIQLDQMPFLKYLQDRFHTPQVKALLGTVAQRFPAAVVMLDLASEMLAGANMEDVSTVLYYKVLEWAGYSRNLKVATLERRIEEDGRIDEFEATVKAQIPGMTWADIRNDPLAVDALIPQLAHEMYPALFPTPNAFSSSTDGFFQFEKDRVSEMIDLIRRKSGKQHILFIVDEVGQYIASRDNLILNLDGLAKNVKGQGDGKVWIVATAQQTLTEDDPRASLNSDKLYKLKDRFPIQVDLEASDIKEICYRRLLGKSPSGEDVLGQLFDTHGQALRHNTKLKDAKFYSADFDRTTFINLYPFLPAHFDILLRLLGALAKSTGGVGLRSAIKVIQDILIEEHNGQPPVADRTVGWLATTVTLYDSLEKDIRRAFPSIHYAAETTCTFYSDQPLHQEVAKSIAVLQILGNLPITVENVASLMHPSVEGASRLELVRQAVEEMLQESRVPLSEKEGELSFLSEKLREIDVERSQIALRSVDVRSILNGSLRESFDPLPRATLLGSLQVVTGLKVLSGSSVQGLAGDQQPVQTLVQFVESTEYEAVRSATVEESRQRQAQTTIYALGRTDPEAQDLTEEIYRCQRIDELYRNDPDQEVRDYCKNQQDRAVRLKITLQQKLQQSLYGGSFVFRGQLTGVSTLGQDLLEAARRQLGEVAEQVFDRYGEAPTRVETSQAEKFLKQTNLSAITSVLDPLDLVQVVSGQPQIQTSHKAIVSIRDYIDRNGTVEGKRLIDHFGDPPFGWSPDTLRYILAAMLVAGEITLRISGREVKAVGQQAIDALKTNKSFGKVGVGLRDYKPPMEVLGRACERLTELLGESVIPLEQEISKAALKQFPKYQRDFSPLGAKLAALGVAGADRLRSLTDELAEVLLSDASDAPERLGGEDSALYENLKWAREVSKALDNGLESTIRQLQEHQREIKQLPNAGVPATLQQELAEDLNHLEQRLNRDDFYSHGADFNTLLTKVQTCVRDAVNALSEQQQQRVKQGAKDLELLPDWQALTEEEKNNIRAELDKLLKGCPDNLAGLRALIGREYSLNMTLEQQKGKIQQLAQKRRQEQAQPAAATGGSSVREVVTSFERSLTVPARIRSVEEFVRLLAQLQQIKDSLGGYAKIDISINIQDQE
ncbi:MAG: BREX system P-loop protein BrxC [Cyanobacteria bacterium P01_H01_bin.162]